MRAEIKAGAQKRKKGEEVKSRGEKKEERGFGNGRVEQQVVQENGERQRGQQGSGREEETRVKDG